MSVVSQQGFDSSQIYVTLFPSGRHRPAQGKRRMKKNLDQLDGAPFNAASIDVADEACRREGPTYITGTPDARPHSHFMNIECLDRRHFITGAASAAFMLSFAPGFFQPAAARAKDFKQAMDEVLKGATPSAEMITLKMPEIAENGNVVSVTLDASAAETAGKTVTALHIYATENPWPYVASFRLSPLSGKALITTRMRLARSQKVIALGELADGSFLLAETFVKVTIGGCGG